MGGGLVNEVAAITLDALMASGTIPARICAIKMDVEGAELGVLQGAESLVSQPELRIIFLEISAPMIKIQGATLLQLLTWLRRRGFTFWKLSAEVEQGRLVGVKKFM